MRSIRPLLPWVWAWTVAACVFVLLVEETLSRSTPLGDTLPGVAMVLLFCFLGALIVVRQPGNVVGWLLLTIGSGVFLSIVVGRVIEAEPDAPSFVHFAALVADNALGISLIMFPLVLITYLFPTGAFFSRRQAWVGWLGAVMVPLNFLVAVFAVELGPSFQGDEGAWLIANPVGFLPSGALDWVLTVWGLAMIPLAIGGIWSLTNRYRKSSETVKAQIRWMMLSSLFLALSFVVLVTIDTAGTGISGLLVTLAFASIPVSITIAITRYRLFEIDRIISRTLTYLLIVVTLGGVYVAGVALLTSLLVSQNSLAVAASTLAVAALFNPLRKRLQRAVDRRFNRSGYEAEAVANRLAGELQDTHDAADIATAWVRTVETTLKPEVISMWLNDSR